MGDGPGEITMLLRRMSAGDGEAREALFRHIYAELHSQAERLMRNQPRGHTLQPTALVNEAYLRLAGGNDEWQNRRHFFQVAARAMRNVLTDHARTKRASKRGGAGAAPLDAVAARFEEQAGDILDLDAALHDLAALDARAAEVVNLRFFAGLTCQEAAEVLGVSLVTVERDWEAARAWLCARLR